jgi:DNA modification methylase
MNKFFSDPWSDVYLGDARDVLAGLPEHSVDMACTSPPYFSLRNYKCEPSIWDGDPNCVHEWGEDVHPPGYRSKDTHPGKIQREGSQHRELLSASFCSRCGAFRGVLGMEPDPNLYIEHLVGIFDLVRRVLKPTGSLFVNLSDTYYSHPSKSHNVGGFQGEQIRKNKSLDEAIIMGKKGLEVPDKSLLGIPERFVVAMLESGWCLRNKIVWYKRSCLPSSARDRFTVDWEPIFWFTVKPHYFFEQQFEPQTMVTVMRNRRAVKTNKYAEGDYLPNGDAQTLSKPRPAIGYEGVKEEFESSLGRNKRTVWDITSQGGAKEAHHAVYPIKLCETPILATCPEYLCPKCGKALKKKYKNGRLLATGASEDGMRSQHTEELMRNDTKKKMFSYEQLPDGYTDCACKPPTVLGLCEPGVVLDPFGGSGSTGVMAKMLGRKSVLIDVSPDYCLMMAKRLRKIQGVQKNLL